MAFEAEAVVNNLLAARQQLITQSYGLLPQQLAERPAEDEWCALEVLAHIPDVYVHYFTQTRRIHGEPGCTLTPFDVEEWKENHPEARSLGREAILAQLAKAHTPIVDFARGLTEEEMGREAQSPRGTITVKGMLERIAGHDRAHARQIAAVREALEKKRR